MTSECIGLISKAAQAQGSLVPQTASMQNSVPPYRSGDVVNQPHGDTHFEEHFVRTCPTHGNLPTRAGSFLFADL
jgi:hypothetical protein